MSWLLYQLVHNPVCLVVPGGAWMGSCITERGALPRLLLVAESRASPAKLVHLKLKRDSPPPFSKKKSQTKEKTQNAFFKTPNPPYPTHDAHVKPTLNIDKVSTTARFLLLSLENNEMGKKSPFLIQKALVGLGGEPKSVKRLRSGDLLIETNSALQTKSFLLAKSFLD
ncbi:uncharacterized protein TNCV_2620681 [Trichonephila clavipes]|uniref:Uncharacterized protein n=1 Tax=Trichonephila clavipes TaxID=2585209 RepID=A0A8X6WD71_TRICX|nr:uncharacterized protein TNCV_2620681 [Trichonephila clavipes]